jgi:hypothetical protein
MEQATVADTAASGENASEALALSRACTALWVATLALMTAFMQTAAPAQRYLIARKIAKNLAMLREEEQVFTAECRMIFGNLAQRWSAKADQLAPDDQRPRAPTGGLLQRAFAKAN